MSIRITYIIGCFLLTIFFTKEIVADMHLSNPKIEKCNTCDAENPGNNCELNHFDKEHKLLAGFINIIPYTAILIIERQNYIHPYLPAVAISISTPPPEFA